ncbi:MAG: ParB/RepB/Spo0J family partition protein [Cypionkella sp.]|nr:ParB/RepB/Spo0J family partition protein [Cypionkella sp.]
MEKKNDRRGLGRGLSALMADVNMDNSRSAPSAERTPDTSLPIEAITPNPNQPRRVFEPQAMEELAESIRQKGVIQPLIVRPSGDGRYEIVAGERRWRAAQAANLHELPVVIRAFSDSEMLEIAIIENIQRADLNAIDEAQAYKQLMDRFGHTQEKIAEGLARSRSHIANLLRLLTLPAPVQDLVRAGRLSSGHARALIGNPDAEIIALQVVAKGLSVRAVEEMMRKPAAQKGGSAPMPRRVSIEKDADTRALEADLAASMKLAVAIDHSASGGGTVTIAYKNLDDLDRICRLMSLGDSTAS